MSHCTAADLTASPAQIPHRPVFYQDAFDPEGTIEINLVTWHELAERPVVIRGQVPPVYTNLNELIEFTRTNLDTFWRGSIKQIEDAGIEAVGEYDDPIAWVGLGPARLHHLVIERELTSKSGAGHYVCESLDPRWNKIGREALRIREDPGSPSLYDDLAQRGCDTYDLLTWLVQDGTGQSGPTGATGSPRRTWSSRRTADCCPTTRPTSRSTPTRSCPRCSRPTCPRARQAACGTPRAVPQRGTRAPRSR